MLTLEVLDLHFLGRPGRIACGLLMGPDGRALIDPGPASTLDGLRRALGDHGLGIADLQAVLVTHVHLDHSGAVGSLVRENPRLVVYVHARGARHLIDPSRLAESAGRLYGDQMAPLWGELLPVPAGNVRALDGGERFEVAGRDIEAAYTPGHAWHHVSYFDTATRVAAAGDVGGMRLADDYLMPPTPPPDIDLEAWRASLSRIAAWHPDALFVTHFGLVQNAEAQLEALGTRLSAVADIVRRSLDEDVSDEARIAGFARAIGEDLRRHLSDEEAVRYESVVTMRQNWQGLARYWRKRTAGTR